MPTRKILIDEEGNELDYRSKCFMRTEMDVLAIENFILLKEEQPDFSDKENWQKLYELD